MYYAGSTRTLATLKSKYKVEDNSPAGEIANPGFTDPNGADNKNGTADDDFSLNGKNINDGADLSKCWYVKVQDTTHKICLDDALDPVKTDWTQTPPVVYTVKQDSYGRGWERGAYVYTGSQSISKDPEETLSAPTGLKIE
jgi:hypothetical protein